MIDLDYKWGWQRSRPKGMPKEAIRDIILNCKAGKEEEFAEKYGVAATYIKDIMRGKKRKKDYQEIKKEIEEGR